MSAPWIPGSPEALLNLASRLEHYWEELERRGYAKPSLAEELALLERHYGAVESNADA
jgi:hypothetical protein